MKAVDSLDAVVRHFLSDWRFEIVNNEKDDFFEGMVESYRLKLKLKDGDLKLIYKGESVGFLDEDKHERLVIIESLEYTLMFLLGGSILLWMF